MSASIKDVAEKAGVSVATVSHVINDTRFVAEATRAKVETAMEELQYVPNSIARSLRTNKSKTVGLLVPDISNFFFTAIAESIEKVLRENGYNLVLCNTDEDLAIERQNIALLNAQLVSGMIIAPTAHDFNYRKLFKDEKFPLVFIDRETDNLQCDTVIVDGMSATKQAVSILIEKGHRKIGYIKGLAGLSTSNDRFLGYAEALQEHGIEVDESLVYCGDSRRESGYGLCLRLLKDKEVTAMYVSNNLMAVGAMQCLADQDVKIPEQMAIIGFDDYNWATITNPPLSTIKQPTGELGAKAARLIVERIENPDAPYKKHIFAAEFIQRKSC